MDRESRWVLGVLIGLAGLSLVRLQAAAGETDGPSSTTVERIVKQARPAVAVITTAGREGDRQGLGTGFLVSSDGLLATNLHVIGEGRPISVQLADGTELPVTTVQAWDRFQDLAVLRVEAAGRSLPALELAETSDVPEGTPVVAIGNPLGLKHSVVSGVVSAKREIEGRQMLQLAIPIEPGNSGGPVLDLRGRVLGVVTMKSAVSNNLGFALDVQSLKSLLEHPNPVPMPRWLTVGALDAKLWQPLFGANWRQRAGRILVDGAGQGFGGRSLCLTLHGPPAIPYEVAVSVKLGEEAGAAGLAFHCDAQDRHYGFYPSNGRLRLSCFQGPSVFSWQVLEEKPSDAYRPGQWNRLKVRVEPERLLCYVNDELVIESGDRSLAAGKVGLAKFRDTTAEFKDFRVAAEIPAARVDATLARRLANEIDKLPPLAQLQEEQLASLAGSESAAVALIHEHAGGLQRQVKELERVAEMIQLRATVDALAHCVQQNPQEFDLLRAALLVAKLDEKDIDIEGYVREVDRIAEEVKAGLPADADEGRRLEALNKYLFQENGFHGSRFEYYHRANSYLNRVIDDREGLPITLSVLYMELGRRLGLNIEGVGLPGHFVVQFVPKSGEAKLIDVFEGGRTLSRDEAAAKVRGITGGPLLPEHLQASPQKDILVRMLRNLQGLAEEANDKSALLRYVEALVAIDAESVQYRGLRALLRFEAGRRDAAVADLDQILDQAPPELDLDTIRDLRERFLQAKQ